MGLAAPRSPSDPCMRVSPHTAPRWLVLALETSYGRRRWKPSPPVRRLGSWAFGACRRPAPARAGAGTLIHTATDPSGSCRVYSALLRFRPAIVAHVGISRAL